MKVVAAGLVVILVLLQYRLWLGDGGLRDVYQLRAEIEAQREQNRALQERNRTLAAEVQDLKKGTVAIEERARTDLGMVGPGETYYQVVTPKASTQPAEPPRSSEPPDEEDEPTLVAQARTSKQRH
jgi:cell division protein FtsB